MSAESDERAIRELIAAYVDAANRHDFRRAAATYAADGVLTTKAGDLEGRAAIEAAFKAVFENRDVIFQVCQPGPLEIQGDRAFTRTWFREWTRKVGKATPRILLGLYQDELVRTPDGWRFSRRKLDSLYTADPDYGGERGPDPVMRHEFTALGVDPAGGL